MNSAAVTLIHLGTGKIGLGFVAQLAHRINRSTPGKIRIVLANRGTSDSRSRNESLARKHRFVVVFPADHTEEEVRFDDFQFTDTEDGLRNLRGFAMESQRLLITTALKDGLSEGLPIISTLAQNHTASYGEYPLFLLACENKLTDGFLEYVRTSADRRIVYLPCVIDRACTDLNFDPQADLVRTEVEAYAKWTIGWDARAEFLQDCLGTLIDGGVVEFVPLPSIEPAKTRKRWLVNGLHLIISALGRGKLGEEIIPRILATDVMSSLVRRAQHKFINPNIYRGVFIL